MTTRTLVDTDSVQIVANKWLDDVRQYQQNVDTLWKHGTINAALSNIGTSTYTTLVVTENTAVNANTDLTSYPNIHWLFLGSGKLTPATGVTLTLYSPDTITADPTQFILDGTSGTVAFFKAGTLHDGWMGASAASSAGTNQAALQRLLTAAPNGSTILISQNFLINDGLQISDKTGLDIHGRGKLTLSGADSGSIIFELAGTVSRLRIAGLELVGEANSGWNQEGIGNFSGQTISNVIFEDLTIHDLNIGIDCNAQLSGSFSGGIIRNNRIYNIVGTAGGQGYGITMAKASNLLVDGNTVDNCQRHGIYQVIDGEQVRIVNNIIKNHRSTVADGTVKSAMVVTRGSKAVVMGNQFLDGYDGGLEISHVTSDARDQRGVIVIGNQFINRKNSNHDIFIGEQSAPSSYNTYDVTISGNYFSNDFASTTGNGDILVANGNGVFIERNMHRRTGISASSTFIELGHNSYISSSNHCTQTIVRHNYFVAEGSDVTNTRGVEVCSDICGFASGSAHQVGPNTGVGCAFPSYLDATNTNPTLLVSNALGIPVVLRANLPAAATAQDGLLIIDDNGAGDRNLMVYSGGQRFRIDGGAAV